MRRVVDRVDPRLTVAVLVEQPWVLDGVWRFALHRYWGRETRRQVVAMREDELLHEPTAETRLRDQLREAA